ncbi:hypothetical protein BVC93_08800 [Mycobacterium sp. MS1601]|nr:hypothetical protein BVC93_08800 [Mycobacterium sp. MS1601]
MERTTPDIDYIDSALFEAIGIVQVAVAGNTIYVSGIAPLTGGSDELRPVGTTFDEQLAYVLEILDRSLHSVGANRCDLVAWTIYTTDMDALSASAPRLREWVGIHPPTSTWLTVSGFIHPEQQLELTAIAVR